MVDRNFPKSIFFVDRNLLRDIYSGSLGMDSLSE